jgi:fumarate hydratase subunit alpha
MSRPDGGTKVRELDVSRLTEMIARLVSDANYQIPADVLEGLRQAAAREESELGRHVLAQLVRNYEVAPQRRVPVCADSGVTVVFLEIGQDVHWVGGDVYEAVHEGIRQGAKEGYLRASVVGDPVIRMNTGNNSPGVVHVELAAGDQVRVTVAPKGFGAENMSALRMLTPAEGIDGVKRFVVATVEAAGANSCPPLIVGVGLGGTFEAAALLAKKAIVRPIDQRHPREDVRRLEKELLERINALGIGPQGMGGTVTALAVNVEVWPTHIAGLPVAVNLACHSNRHMSATI